MNGMNDRLEERTVRTREQTIFMDRWDKGQKRERNGKKNERVLKVYTQEEREKKGQAEGRTGKKRWNKET